MATSNPVDRRLGIALAALALVLTAAVLATTIMASPAAADVTVDSFDVEDRNETVDGDVSGVGIETDLAFEHSVPDAEQRIVELHVGPSEDDLESVGFVRERDPAGDDSGTVEVNGDLTDHSAWSVDDFDPDVADTTEREVVVQATMKIERENGETVERDVTDTATVTIQDGTELTGELGGDGTITVDTE